MPSIEVIYFSGSAHTAQHAQAIQAGASELAEATVREIPHDGDICDDTWRALDAADAIVFGAENESDAANDPLNKLTRDSFRRYWGDKIAACFVPPAIGAETEAQQRFWDLACRHGMTWVAPGEPDDLGDINTNLRRSRDLGRQVAELADAFS
ncbi:hypothetical protein [Pseudaestuariivita rosea]|uniref:hypothetical protein n=1 Tax=Pseudaestuariivita rosea TaxID=2763263 RepID=UPI001ABB9C87|nr:hypothetical protein [Pseudaestuariivita rosea]